jgi:uncharacterized protein YecE (DUF72 family)
MTVPLADCYIGTSGWRYDHWIGSFYPESMGGGRDFLPFYADRLRAVEINNSFYQLPAEETLDRWRETVPDPFRFAAKASRYITHMKKLTDPEDTLPPFLDRMRRLGDRLGPVLFQLPPRWRFNPERLAAFLAALPDGFRYAMEFRDPSWRDDRALAALERAGVAFCIHELAGDQSPRAVTADLVYIRLHGPGQAYQGRYDTQTLAGWAGAISAWRREGRIVYCFFDNDEAGYAAENARFLAEMLEATP